MTKDPKRWQDVLIDSPFGNLTKQDVHDYYDRPGVRRRILDAIRETGARETILRQSFSPENVVLRRKDHKGNLIHMRGAKSYNDWNQQRMTEIHPTFGKTTNTLLADIDPGKEVGWIKTKTIAETVAKTMSSDKGVKEVKIQFSGDDGFYVKGILKKKMDINAARNKVKDLMQGIAMRPDITLAKAKVDQIRIDTTPIKIRGSIKAPYSLSAQTGLVAAPIALKDLLKIQKSDFHIDRIKVAAEKIAKKEFAPGIPAAKKIDPIPSIQNKAWTLSIQQHDAQKAGKHYDVRLVDPKTEKAHSFAVPKARLPGKKDRMLLAIQQPTHTANYALNFEGKIPTGTYGAGAVKIKLQEPIDIIKANADKIHFERSNGRGYVLFRTQGNNWGFRQKKS